MARAIDAEKVEAKLQYDIDHCAGYFNKAVLSMLLDYIRTVPTLTPPNEWVSVDNKLPKNGVPVLICNPKWDYPVVANYAGHGVWMDSWHQKMTFTPTYWMPLPKSPKEDE